MSRTTLIRYGGTSKGLMAAIVKTFTKKLIADGRAIIRRACETRDTQRETGAQENAYCTGVYYNGELQVMAFADVAPQTEANKGRYWGRKMAKEFLKSGFQPKLAGFCLVVANVMWYSVLQEEGVATKRGYKRWNIISQEYQGLWKALADLKKENPKLKIRGRVTTFGSYE